MSDKHRRYFLKAREANVLLDGVSKRLKVDLRQVVKARVNVEVVEAGFAEIYLINGKPVLAKTEEGVFPTLVFSEFLASAPKIVVDMGAIPHVCNGANVMAPGIRSVEGEFVRGDFVVVVDERHGKPVALGEIMYDADEAKRAKQGIIVKNVHFVSDRTWNFIKKLETMI